MVPDRMMPTGDTRLTGDWWLARKLGWFGRVRYIVMVEIEEGWMWNIPPPPGREPAIDWRLGARRATESEIEQIRVWPNRTNWTYDPAPTRNKMRVAGPMMRMD